MRREPIIRRIRPDETGRVLDRRRVRRFYLLITPVLLPILVIAAGAIVVWGTEFPDHVVVGGSLIGVGVVLFIAYCIYESFLIGHYPAKCYLRWLRERIDRRTDAIVAADDPDAFFVQIIPREKWSVAMGENATDVGLLRVDPKRGELRYEGDLERWIVPAEYIRSFRLKSFTPPGSMPGLNGYTVVLLEVDLDDEPDPWETPLAVHPIHLEFWTPAKRKRGAELLRRSIGHVVDPDRWPPVDEEELRPLRPPTGR